MTTDRLRYTSLKARISFPRFNLLKVLLLIGFILNLILFAGSGQPAHTQEVADSNSKQTYLPIITNSYVYLPLLSIFGAQMNGVINEAEGLSQAVNGGVYWVRFDAFDWDRIEPVPTAPSTFHWENVDEGSLLQASQNGLNVIAVVKYTPDWAQKIPGSACGPIKSTAFAEYAEFLTALVNRYKNPPYNIKYWELGNEIDAPGKWPERLRLLGGWERPLFWRRILRPDAPSGLSGH